MIHNRDSLHLILSSRRLLLHMSEGDEQASNVPPAMSLLQKRCYSRSVFREQQQHDFALQSTVGVIWIKRRSVQRRHAELSSVYSEGGRRRGSSPL